MRLWLDAWSWTSIPQANVGNSAQWSDLSGISTPVTGDMLKYKRLGVEIWDKNMSVDEKLATGEVALRKPAVNIGKDTQLALAVRDKKGLKAGNVEISVVVDENEVLPGLDGSTTGYFEIVKIATSNLRRTGLMKQDPYILLKYGSTWKHSTKVNQNGGANCFWDTSISVKTTIGQLQREKLRCIVMDKCATGDVEIGRCEVSGAVTLAAGPDWCPIECDLTHDTKPAGKVVLNCKFNSSSTPSFGDEAAPPPSANTKELADLNALCMMMSEKQAVLAHKVTGLEDSLKLQLQKELEVDRKRLFDALHGQTARLSKSIEQVSSELSKSLARDTGGVISELNTVKLPLNISEWRSSHAQAWLAYRLDLPQYLQIFKEASIDGLLLLKYVDDEILHDTLGITNALHRRKIVEGIEYLKAKQYELERKIALKRQEESAKAVKPENKKSKTKKKGKKKSPSKGATWFGEVREHNDIERVKLVREMKTMREKKAAAKKATDAKANTWKFEYTGGYAPGTNEVWGTEKQVAHETQAYKNTMRNLFNSDELAPELSGGVMTTGPTQTVPSNASKEEVLAIVRAAMFQVSSRLIAVQRMMDEKTAAQDDDLDELDDVDELKAPSYTEGPEDDDFMPPPAYETVTETEESQPKRISFDPHDTTSKKYDRTKLVYEAFINQQNNGARWLGSNDKLTRLKFHGGFESILRLRVSWPQFDMIWNDLDSVRSGELDLAEFKMYFGDFSEFESDRAGEWSTSNQAMNVLIGLLFELCNAMRYAGFSVIDVFSSFDRNGSGEISFSEFCSLLRVVLGRNVDKKQVYKAFYLVDADCNKSISCNEVLMFIYNIWKSQLQELAGKLSQLDAEFDKELVSKMMKERADIKEAIKRNFPREWRDRLERLGGTMRHTGPFNNILEKMNLGKTSRYSQSASAPIDTAPRVPMSPQKPFSPKSSRGGRNEMMRYRLEKEPIPMRQGATLTIPVVKSMNNEIVISEGNAVSVLSKTEPASSSLFAPRLR